MWLTASKDAIRSSIPFKCGGLFGLLWFMNAAHATEGGRSIYPHGPENTPLALPPPGVYFTNFVDVYRSNRFNDGQGRSLIDDFDLNVEADIVRATHVTQQKLLGASFAWQALLPFVHIDVKAGGRQQSKAGVGDLTLTPFILGWHAERFHWAVATDVTFPTGAYDKNDLAHAGLNIFNVEPILIASYSDPQGFEVSAKMMYDFNFENPATKYRSGQEFHVDYFAGWHLGKLTLGVNGYAYQQVTDDQVNGVRVGADGNRGRALAFGPLLRYDIGHVPIVLSWQHEAWVQDRPEGDKFWLKVIIPL